MAMVHAPSRDRSAPPLWLVLALVATAWLLGVHMSAAGDPAGAGEEAPAPTCVGCHHGAEDDAPAPEAGTTTALSGPERLGLRRHMQEVAR